eukprot:m.78901 g.78901  ORF g.78901 m.78901 type:complete len:505 (+) comp12550_c0_seq5:1907-3421(+)
MPTLFTPPSMFQLYVSRSFSQLHLPHFTAANSSDIQRHTLVQMHTIALKRVLVDSTAELLLLHLFLSLFFLPILIIVYACFCVCFAFTDWQGERLVCLQNPWGEFEWNGAWSDDAPQWTDALKAEVGFKADSSDGLFWMCFQDFLKYFTRVNICYTHSHRGSKWQDTRVKGRITYTGEGVEFPMFSLNLATDSEVWLSVHQNDERVLQGQPYVDIGLVVMKVNEDGTHTFVDAAGGSWKRQEQLRIPTLDAGDYLIVPFTSGHQRMHEAPVRPRNVFDDDGELSQRYLTILWEIFRRFDDDMDGFLNLQEMNNLLELAQRPTMTMPEFSDFKMRHDSSAQGITRDGFVHYMKIRGEDILKEVIKLLGYNDHLVLIGQRRFVVSVHSECNARLRSMPYNPKTALEATMQWVKAKGTRSDYDGGNLSIYQLNRKDAGVTLAASSQYQGKACQVTIDCSGSENVSSVSKDLVVQKSLQPDEFQVYHHLHPVEPKHPWRWAYKLSLMA